MFENEDSDLFRGSKADLAEKHANSVHETIRIFRGWQDFLEQVPDDTERDQIKINRTIKAVEMALTMMEDLYPQLAVHAALMRIREEEMVSTSLDPENDRSYG